ncbi:saccharopine dehydrogenase-like oxidoreductase [Zophobas morio]|uniref:saccharopine dehydrogenase-like oxidoreductase n=1 Tax=Zophobas morio TaxID=2755281 RepID=UPI003083884D
MTTHEVNQKLDIVIFGATGFTGKFVIRTIAKLSKTKNRQFTWGVAGRSEEKLKQILSDCANQIEISLDGIPVIVADLKQEESLKGMARRARVIINCCGPFVYFGEPVLRACIEEGTHHLDVSAEVHYMEEMQLKYHKQAEEKGVYVISACAYQSIPVDLGIVYMQQHFTGTLNSVEAYLEYWEEGNSAPGSAFNYSTWESAIYVLANAKTLEKIRSKLFPRRLPDFEPKLQMKMLPHKSEVMNSWVFPFDGTDRPVVQRSQRYFYERHSKRPVQIETYFSVKSFTQLLLINIFALLVLVLSKFSIGRKLLLKYPETFSGGLINRTTPSEEKTENIRFSMTLYGEGWKEKLPDADHQYSTTPNQVITVKVSGRNPGYGGTAIILVLAAITLVSDIDKMPSKGGVYPPGYAFANTSLADKLNENGVKFEILQNEELSKSK